VCLCLFICFCDLKGAYLLLHCRVDRGVPFETQPHITGQKCNQKMFSPYNWLSALCGHSLKLLHAYLKIRSVTCKHACTLLNGTLVRWTLLSRACNMLRNSAYCIRYFRSFFLEYSRKSWKTSTSDKILIMGPATSSVYSLLSVMKHIGWIWPHV
jgi:hypothetical protein